MTGPPAGAERMLARWLPESEREAVLGDLEESFAADRRRFGPLRARLRYWRAAIGVLAAIRRRRSPDPLRGRRSRDPWVLSLGQDVRYGLRVLGRSPGFAAVTIVTLALGIGATTAIYTAVDTVLFRDLPYPEPEGLVMVWESDLEGGESNLGFATVADLARDARSLRSIAAMAYWTPALSGDGGTERLLGQSVSASFFRTLGVRPMLGQDFTAADDRPDANRVVLLGHGLWQRRFGGDRSVVGGTIEVNGVPYRVAGVLPPDFESLLAPGAEIWRPLGYDPGLSWACRTCRHLRAVARTAPGLSLSQVDAELDRLSDRYVGEHPTEYPAAGFHPTPLHEQLVRPVRPALLILLGAVALVLLVACANVANLTLAAAARRAAEFNLRATLGAGGLRIARQLLTEGALLGLLGGGAGLLVGWWGVHALAAWAPPEIPRVAAMRLDAPLLALASAVSIAIGMLFGLAPLTVFRHRTAGVPAAAARQTAGPGRRTALSGLVVAEVTLACMLLAGAGLLVRSVDRLLDVDPGFDADRLLTMQVLASGPDYREDEPIRAVQDEVLAAVRAVPGVAAAAFVSQVPLGGNRDSYGVLAQDQPLDNPEEAPSADRYAVTPDYLDAMAIPLRRGRAITPADRADAEPVVLVNETLARTRWPGEDAIGRRIRVGGSDSPWRTVVGVVADVRHAALDAEQSAQFYVPTLQWPWAESGMVLVTRSGPAPESLMPAVRGAVWSVDDRLAISDVAQGRELVNRSAAQRRFALRLFQLFALVALALAAAGIYGVLAGMVTARTRELGIRSALGSTRSGILGLVLRQGMRLAGLGLALGAAGALAGSPLIRHLLFGISPADPITLLAVAITMAAVGLIACAVPAWRAARVDPVRALKAD